LKIENCKFISEKLSPLFDPRNGLDEIREKIFKHLSSNELQVFVNQPYSRSLRKKMVKWNLDSNRLDNQIQRLRFSYSDQEWLTVENVMFSWGIVYSQLFSKCLNEETIPANQQMLYKLEDYIHSRFGMENFSPLHYFSWIGDTSMVKKLLVLTTHPNMENDENETAFALAVKSNNKGSFFIIQSQNNLNIFLSNGCYLHYIWKKGKFGGQNGCQF